MAHIIALAGKGGTGKTTTAGLLVRLLVEQKAGPVLAVDADPNSNLGETLGVPDGPTVGGILDQVAAHADEIPGGMSKDRYIEYQVQTAVKEAEGFDCLTMGKPEGPGCYCYVNNVLRDVVERLIGDYRWVIIDNEAGLEHLSRRTTRRCDTLLVIASDTPVALRAAQRISVLADELKIKTGRKVLLVNAAAGDIRPERLAGLRDLYAGRIPYDEAVERSGAAGGSIWDLPSSSPAYLAVRRFVEGLIRK